MKAVVSFFVVLLLCSPGFAQQWGADSAWVKGLSRNEQRVVILVLRGKLNGHISDVLLPAAKNDPQRFSDALKFVTQGNALLLSISTNSPDLKGLFQKKVSVTTQYIRGEINANDFRIQSSSIEAEFQNVLKSLSEPEIEQIVRLYKKQLDSTVSSLILNAPKRVQQTSNQSAQEPTAVVSSLSELEKKEIEQKLSTEFAVKHLKNLQLDEINLLQFPENQFDVTLLSASGALTSKLIAWRDAKKSSINDKAFAYAYSIATTKLSKLARSMGQVKISACHWEEASYLNSIANGSPIKSATCRQDVYAGVEEKALTLFTMKQLDQINAAVNKWAVDAVAYSIEVAYLDEKYK